MMKFSWAISRVKWLSGEKTNVSKTISVLVLRVLVLPWGRGQRWSSKRWFSHHSTIWRGWWPERTSSYSVAGKATNLIKI